MAGVAGGAARWGTPARGGASPPDPKCFNNIDDDCDGRIDCADSDCALTVAQCVALDPTSGRIGVSAGVGMACPTGYACR
jgi:hypothetical protein